jgi:hypothetical protein
MNKKLTITDVFERKRKKDLGDGYFSVFDFGKFSVSIVGGQRGLYGDFKDTFEVAVIDNKSRNFVTKLFCGGGDVMGWQTAEQVENILNIFTGVPSPKKQGGGVD